jgi:hypothetical protein
VITSTRRSSPGIVLCVKLALSLSSFLIASLRINRGAIIADSRQYCQCGRAVTLTEERRDRRADADNELKKIEPGHLFRSGQRKKHTNGVEDIATECEAPLWVILSSS